MRVADGLLLSGTGVSARWPLQHPGGPLWCPDTESRDSRGRDRPPGSRPGWSRDRDGSGHMVYL